MINEGDGSFDYSAMGRRPRLFIENCAMQVMAAIGADMNILRETLHGLTGGSFMISRQPSSAYDSGDAFNGTLPDMAGRRMNGEDHDEILFTKIRLGRGLTYVTRDHLEERRTAHLRVSGQDFPETVVQRMKSMPLDRILRHEWIHVPDLTVIEASNERGSLMLRLEPHWTQL